MYVKVDHPEKECSHCRLVYKPTTSHQNFCSKKCYKKFGKKHFGHSEGKPRVRAYIPAHLRKTHYRAHKKDSCESCGFIPEHRCQLDVDHVDGDHDNNNVENLQTLCANCHRLKTYKQRWGK